MQVTTSCSWIWKAILKQRDSLLQIQGWEDMKGSMITRKVYQVLKVDYPSVDWKVTMYQNFARPRAIFTFWLTCHGRLATKDRLRKFGVNVETTCCFCNHEESIDHLFFRCHAMKVIWQKVLHWMQIDRTPLDWHDELCWITRHSKGKGWRAQLIKAAAAETIYMLWKYRNDTCFANQVHDRNIDADIINTLVYRGWGHTKLRKHIAILLL
jgi:hypothetical protein